MNKIITQTQMNFVRTYFWKNIDSVKVGENNVIIVKDLSQQTIYINISTIKSMCSVSCVSLTMSLG